MNVVMALAHRRDPSWALIILPLFHARGKTKRTSFFYLFTPSISMLIIHTFCRSFWISSNVSLVRNSFTPHHLSALKCIKVVQRNRLGHFRESKGSTVSCLSHNSFGRNSSFLGSYFIRTHVTVF